MGSHFQAWIAVNVQQKTVKKMENRLQFVDNLTLLKPFLK